ncbi:P2 family phage major capsid protein [Klebsiella pneumoniae]|uniref:P2 family phage major capsid protein n=1 Tax=Klebsiella pneumoniae TaxID=573 RepID=UPI003986DCAE
MPYFPANAIMVTRLDNLSIYFMDESHRRSIIENPKLDQAENYESMNIDYVVETLTPPGASLKISSWAISLPHNRRG